MGHFRTYWDILVCFGMLLDVLGQFRTLCYFLVRLGGILGVFWGRFGTFWDILGRLGAFCDVLRRYGMFLEVLGHFRTFLNLLGHFGTF